MGLSRPAKRAILLSADLLTIVISLYAAFGLRFGTASPIEFIGASWILFPLIVLVCAPLALALRLPNLKLNTFENSAMMRIGLCAIGLTITAMVLSYALGLGAPRSVPLIMGAAFFVGSSLTRILGYLFLYVLRRNDGNSIPVAVYGAGAAGIQLVSALRQSREVRPILFVDDNPTLHGLLVAGLKVESPKSLSQLAEKGRIERVLLAIPSISAKRRDALVTQLKNLSLSLTRDMSGLCNIRSVRF
jgi:FlaA1/EpsC-like NDP-sugar epimerase